MAKTFMHIGVPTNVIHPNENYAAGMNVFITPDTNEHHVEWLRFANGPSILPDVLKTANHIAYKVDDIEKELVGKKIIFPLTEIGPGTRIAFIQEDELPIEYYEQK